MVPMLWRRWRAWVRTPSPFGAVVLDVPDEHDALPPEASRPVEMSASERSS